MVPTESRVSEGVPFDGESVTRHLADIGPRRVPESGHVTIKKIENLHTDTRIKINCFQKCCSFRSKTKNDEIIAENRFRKVASLALVDAWPS